MAGKWVWIALEDCMSYLSRIFDMKEGFSPGSTYLVKGIRMNVLGVVIFCHFG